VSSTYVPVATGFPVKRSQAQGRKDGAVQGAAKAAPCLLSRGIGNRPSSLLQHGRVRLRNLAGFPGCRALQGFDSAGLIVVQNNVELIGKLGLKIVADPL